MQRNVVWQNGPLHDKITAIDRTYWPDWLYVPTHHLGQTKLTEAVYVRGGISLGHGESTSIPIEDHAYKFYNFVREEVVEEYRAEA